MYKLLLAPNYIRVSTGANAHQFSQEVVLFDYEPCHEKTCPLLGLPHLPKIVNVYTKYHTRHASVYTHPYGNFSRSKEK